MRVLKIQYGFQQVASNSAGVFNRLLTGRRGLGAGARGHLVHARASAVVCGGQVELLRLRELLRTLDLEQPKYMVHASWTSIQTSYWYHRSKSHACVYRRGPRRQRARVRAPQRRAAQRLKRNEEINSPLRATSRPSNHRAEESKCCINRCQAETVVGLPWAADSCPSVVEAAKRVNQ